MLVTALPFVWSFDLNPWDSLDIAGDAFSTTTGFVAAPRGPRPGTLPTTVPIEDHRYQNVVGSFDTAGFFNRFDDMVSGIVQHPGIDSSTFTNRGNVLGGFPAACCVPPRGYGVDGTFYFPFTDQADSKQKMAAVPWLGGPATVTTIDPVVISISTSFGTYSQGFAFITYDFNDLAHIYSAPANDPTAMVETGTIPAANPGFTSGHQELGGDVTWSHSCFVNMPPATNPASMQWRLHNLFPATGVDGGSTLIRGADFSAPLGFYRAGVSAVPFHINSQIEPVCVGVVPDPGGDTLTAFAAITETVGPPTSMRTVDMPGVVGGTPVVGAVDNVVWGITPSIDGSRCFMCNFGDLSADPFCMVMSGLPFVTHANRLDDDGQSANEAPSGRIPVVNYIDGSLRSDTIGGEQGFVLHPLDNEIVGRGPAPPGTEVVYGSIDVPFFFHNFESGDFRFWSSVAGQAGG